MLEYKNITQIVGPLLLVEGVSGIGYDELCEVVLQGGGLRRGKVLELDGDKALVQLFEPSHGISPSQSRVRFLGKSLSVKLSPDLLGRIFDGMGNPKDGYSEVIAKKIMPAVSEPINPVYRQFPSQFLQTGISAIDGMNTLVRGQKLPIFSGAGLPHKELAAQIVTQARVLDNSVSGEFCVVFAGIGITHDEAEFFMNSFATSGAGGRVVSFINLASDPPIERLATPKVALTVAEYLAYELGHDVLCVMSDMTNYAEALREVSASRKEVPGRRGYPGYLYTDFATIYERAGCLRGRRGSITQIPILTMPEGDITHPIPDLTGYITEGQLILDRALFKKGIYPPMAVLPSLSRLKQKGIGVGKTREDHAEVTNQLFASYARGREAKELATILGESALSKDELAYADFSTEFEKRFVAQAQDENRSIEETLDLAWELLRALPRDEMKRVSTGMLARYYDKT